MVSLSKLTTRQFRCNILPHGTIIDSVVSLIWGTLLLSWKESVFERRSWHELAVGFLISGFRMVWVWKPHLINWPSVIKMKWLYHFLLRTIILIVVFVNIYIVLYKQIWLRVTGSQKLLSGMQLFICMENIRNSPRPCSMLTISWLIYLRFLHLVSAECAQRRSAHFVIHFIQITSIV